MAERNLLLFHILATVTALGALLSKPHQPSCFDLLLLSHLPKIYLLTELFHFERFSIVFCGDYNVNAGVIEGFFGRPWDWSARHSIIDFLRYGGYQMYIYAPKGDPFLRRRWREPLPEGTLRHLSALSAYGAANGISIGVGLTPFEIYLNYDAAAKAALRSKVLQINETNAQILCILFDDMRGDVDQLPMLQADIVADICAWSSAQQFIVCPTYYSYDSRLIKEFGPPPKAYLRDLGRRIDPQIDIFWTGEKVIFHGSSIEHLIDVATHLNRKPLIWDNSISNDSKLRTGYLYLDPSADGWQLPVVCPRARCHRTQPYASDAHGRFYRVHLKCLSLVAHFRLG